MEQVFLIIGTHQTDVINEATLNSQGLTTEQSFGVQTTEIIGDQSETFKTELEATEALQEMEKTNDFWDSWDFVEIKKVFIKSK